MQRSKATFLITSTCFAAFNNELFGDLQSYLLKFVSNWFSNFIALHKIEKGFWVQLCLYDRIFTWLTKNSGAFFFHFWVRSSSRLNKWTQCLIFQTYLFK